MRDNKGERGRDVMEDRGRDDRWRDCVKGGFCLINCFSGARECQTFWTSPAAVLRHCGVYDACRRAYSPPLLGVVLCLRASSLSLSLSSWRQTSLAAASYWPLSESFSTALRSNSAPPGRRSDKFSSCPRVLVPQLPGCPGRFMEQAVKAFRQGMTAMIASSPPDTPE